MERPFGVWRRVSGLLVFAGTSALLVVGACQDSPTTIDTKIVRDTILIHDTVTVTITDTLMTVDTLRIFCWEVEKDKHETIYQCEDGYRGPR